MNPQSMYNGGMQKHLRRLFAVAVVAALCSVVGHTQSGPYKLLDTKKVGGDGGWDYVNADSEGRRLYVARRSTPPHIVVYNLDTFAQVGEIANVGAHGAVVDPKSHHGFASSKPLTMFDSNTLAAIKKIDVQGNPDGLLYDPFNARVWVLSHAAPNATIIDAATGDIVTTLDLGGAPEQGQSDGKGTVYIDIEDKDNIAVVDAKNLKVTGHYDLAGKGGGCAGLGLDIKNSILFATCHDPQNMVIVNAKDGKVLDALLIGRGTDGGGFNQKTLEAFSSNGDGTLTVVKEESPTKFSVLQNVQTRNGARTMTIDEKTGKVILITADFGPPPSPAPTPDPSGRGGRGGGRGPMVPDSFSILIVGR
jgi:DNA-binding beta-propeller fold protein YncE